MYKLTLLTTLVVLFTTGPIGRSPIAIASTVRSPATALEWNLDRQGKFDGASVRTRQLPDDTWEIFEWRVLNTTQPTDVEVDQIIDNYELAEAARLVDAAADILTRDAAAAILKSTPRTEVSVVGLRNRVAEIERYLFGEEAQ